MIKNRITQERWERAQKEEMRHHIDKTILESFNFYNKLYGQYFEYLNIEKNLNGKKILEIGPARISSLLFCENYGDSYIVEPSIFLDTDDLYRNLPITFIRDSYEECDSPIVDEIWLLNVLQHVLDPDLIVEKAKKFSNIIRFFEPINTPVEEHHPHSFTLDDYISYFGDSVKLYHGNNYSFHIAECAYGVFKND